MEIHAIQKDFYIMIIKPHISFLLVLLLCATACHAKSTASSLADGLPENEQTGQKEVSIEKKMNKECLINEAFKQALLHKEFIVHPPEKIDKPKIVDNIRRIKPLFAGKEEIFFSYSELSRYAIDNRTNKVSARLYCFEFEKSEDAAAWFDAVDQSKAEGNRRSIVFSKPKKLLALAQNQVVLLEGYHISNFDVLNYIIDKLDNVQAVLGPKTTMRMQ